MNCRSHSGASLLNRLPEVIKASAFTIIKVAKSRYTRIRDRNSKPCYYLKGSMIEPSYEEAKKAETIDRNLHRAIALYAKSASEGEKIDSCIKDFASVLHQMGYTKEAVEFLSTLRSFYEGDINRYDRLRSTLERQLTPSGKHECKSILFELPSQEKPTKEFLDSLFENSSRIKNVKVHNHLAFTYESEQAGKWFIFEFQSFSAAKKTLEKFKFEEWFGINKFWVKGNLITCEATDGREDFENGLVVTKQMIEDNLLQYWSYDVIMQWNEVQALHYYNECAKMLIEKDLAETSLSEELENQNFNCRQFHGY